MGLVIVLIGCMWISQIARHQATEDAVKQMRAEQAKEISVKETNTRSIASEEKKGE
jgi:hypothetical protein